MLTLDECKRQLRIELENTTDDDFLDELRERAASWVCNFCNVDSLEVFDDDSPPASPFVLPGAIKSGMLLHVEAMYARDETMMERLLKHAEWCVMPYRRELGV